MYIIIISQVHEVMIDHKVCWSRETHNEPRVSVFLVRLNVYSKWSSFRGRFLPCINDDMGGTPVTNSWDAHIKTR
jgi:hypothetical protein